MQYGIITNGILIRKKSMTPGYKPIKYGDIPEGFYEESHYLIESEPVEHDDYIQVDYVAKEIEIYIKEDSELTLEEVKAGIEERKEKYFEERNKKEVSEIDMLEAKINKTLALQSAESLELAVNMTVQQNIEAARSQAELIETIMMMGVM